MNRENNTISCLFATNPTCECSEAIQSFTFAFPCTLRLATCTLLELLNDAPHQPPPTAEFAALSQLHKGASFAEVCANLSEQFSEQEAATVAAEGLRTWLGDELIVGLTGINE